MTHHQSHIPGVTAPIPPTDPERAALYQHPRPGMTVGYAPGDPRANPYYAQASHFPPGYAPPLGAAPVAPANPRAGLGYSQPFPGNQNHGRPDPEPDPAPPVRGRQVYKPIKSVNINGVDYGVRDLGGDDAFEFWNLIEQAATWGTSRATSKLGSFIRLLAGKNETAPDPNGPEEDENGKPKFRTQAEAWILPIIGPFLGISLVREEALGLLASLLLDGNGSPLTAADLKDSSRFPLREYPKLYTMLETHPDLQSFFGWFKGRRAAPAAAMAQISQKVAEIVSEMGLDPEPSAPSSTDGSE